MSGAPVIEFESVDKTYGSRRRRTVAVDSLSMAIESGGVHGFLGPNGSGKTTTIRIALGLVGADSGRIRVLGADVPGGLSQVAGSVGALVESPQLFPAFSGRRNLVILARLAGLSGNRVDQMLELVGLTERADDRVRGYSLGMRQRLAIAAAMLKDPRLLILDEPTNGLDPAGMVEVRELIRRLGSQGDTTVFLSSHLLAEIAAVCDGVTIIGRGAMIASGSVAEILARASSGQRLVVRVPDPHQAVVALDAAGLTAVGDPRSSSVTVESADGAHVNYVLATSGQWASEITVLRPDLEAAFLELTAPGESQ